MAVIVRVMLAGFLGVMLGVDVMPLRHMRVMTGQMMVATFVMIGRCFVMLGGMFVMLCSFAVMFRRLFRHGLPPGGMISSENFSRMTAG
jgi:hypothetical protein